MRKVLKWRAPQAGALVVGVVLLLGGCASGSSSLVDSLDSNHDSRLSRDEWDRGFDDIDQNGDGVVAVTELDAAAGYRPAGGAAGARGQGSDNGGGGY